jgi:hypothetical protein
VKLAAVASYVLALGGFAVMMSAFMQTLGSLEYRDARNSVVNMLRTRPHRAVAMCSTETGTFFDAIGAAIKTAATTKTRDITIIQSASRPSYDAACMMLGMKWKKIVGRGKLGTLASVGGLAIAVKGGAWPIVLVVFAGLSVLGLLWTFVHKLEIDRSFVLARQEVLPEVDRMLAEGRYP